MKTTHLPTTTPFIASPNILLQLFSGATPYSTTTNTRGTCSPKTYNPHLSLSKYSKAAPLPWDYTPDVGENVLTILQ